MKTKIFTLSLSLATLSLMNAQTTVFSEDYETSPVTSMVNTFGLDVPDGGSPCGKASRGNTSDFNSGSVDFLNAQNSTYFLGVNPESPCGGYYTAEIEASGLDWSGTDSLVFSMRYFIGTGLSWGSTVLDVTFDDGTNTQTYDAEFSTIGAWTDFEVSLPTVFADASSVTITINMGGGEGVGIDDFLIVNYEPTISATPISLSTFSYNEGNGPSTEQTIDVSGIYLKSDITITAPIGFEVSETSGSGFGSSLTLTSISGTVSSTTVYVRLADGLSSAASPYTGDINISSLDAINVDIPVEGIVNESLASTLNYGSEIVKVYPNPFERELLIRLQDFYSEIELLLMSSTGQVLVKEQFNNTDRIQLNNEVPSGVYFLRIQTPKSTQVMKVIRN